MAYVKNTWQSGDVITAEKLNHAESGIAAASKEVLLFKLASQPQAFTLETENMAAFRDIVNAADPSDAFAVNSSAAIYFDVSLYNASNPTATYTGVAAGYVTGIEEASGYRIATIKGDFVLAGDGEGYTVAPGTFEFTVSLNSGTTADVDYSAQANIIGADLVPSATGTAHINY